MAIRMLIMALILMSDFDKLPATEHNCNFSLDAAVEQAHKWRHYVDQPSGTAEPRERRSPENVFFR